MLRYNRKLLRDNFVKLRWISPCCLAYNRTKGEDFMREKKIKDIVQILGHLKLYDLIAVENALKRMSGGVTDDRKRNKRIHHRKG